MQLFERREVIRVHVRFIGSVYNLRDEDKKDLTMRMQYKVVNMRERSERWCVFCVLSVFWNISRLSCQKFFIGES